MIKNEIGKNIIKLRKKYKMTQEEFAKEIKISEKLLEKLEEGKATPDIIALLRISNRFNVSIYTIINGNEKEKEEIIKSENSEFLDKLISKIKKKDVIKNIIIAILVIFIILTNCLYFYNTNNKDTNYYFYGKSNNFEFKNGNVNFSKNNIEISNFNLVENAKLSDNQISSLTISIYIDKKMWASTEYNSNKNMEFIEWLNQDVVFSEEVSPECRLQKQKNCGLGVFAKIKKEKFPENLSVEIKYCTIDGNCDSENLTIVAYQVITNKD